MLTAVPGMQNGTHGTVPKKFVECGAAQQLLVLVREVCLCAEAQSLHSLDHFGKLVEAGIQLVSGAHLDGGNASFQCNFHRLHLCHILHSVRLLTIEAVGFCIGCLIKLS